MSAADPEQPLAGIRVIDMTTLAMGPLAAQILGDYGAAVIKVEPPAGDPFRHSLPQRSPGMGHAYLQFNRNKRSLAIDLKDAEARAAFDRLIARADVVVSNLRPAAMAGLALDAAAVRALNPGVIYCAAYGFSEEGPYAGRPAADDTIQAMSGLVDLQGRATGDTQLVATVVADKAAGLTLANAVLAALIQRMRTGRGQTIELPMFETMVAFVLPEHLAGLAFEPQAGPSGYNRIVNPARRPYATKDGRMSVLPYTTPQWQRFFRLIGREDLATDPALADPATRNPRIPELYELIAAVLPERTTAEWRAALLEADILFGEVMSPEALIEDPHLVATGTFPLFTHPSEGAIRLLRPPARTNEDLARIRTLPPRLGQDTRAILRELDLTDAQITALARRKAVLLDGEERT